MEMLASISPSAVYLPPAPDLTKHFFKSILPKTPTELLGIVSLGNGRGGGSVVREQVLLDRATQQSGVSGLSLARGKITLVGGILRGRPCDACVCT